MPRLSVYPLKPGDLCKQTARSFQTNDNHDVTHPEDDGIGEQEEFEKNIGESVTVSDLVVVGHRVRPGDS